MDGSPHHRSVKVHAPGVVSCNDGVLLLATCDVLATGIDAPMAEETGDLSVQLLKALIAAVPRRGAVASNIWIWHTPATVQLQRRIKLPFAQARLILGSDKTFILVGQGLFAKYTAVG